MTAKAAAKPAAKSSPVSTEIDAITLLENDHAEVKAWFDDYEELEDDDEKEELAGKICTALTVHAQIEEEIFYPAAREEIEDDELLDDATVEHAAAKNLIAEIEDSDPGQPLYDAKVRVLGEQMRHHIKDEEGELFPEVRDSDLDLAELGQKMAARKAELMSQMDE